MLGGNVLDIQLSKFLIWESGKASLAEKFWRTAQGCARDLLSRDRDETETRRCSFRDTGRDLEAPETFESLGSFNVSHSRRDVFRNVW